MSDTNVIITTSCIHESVDNDHMSCEQTLTFTLKNVNVRALKKALISLGGWLIWKAGSDDTGTTYHVSSDDDKVNALAVLRDAYETHGGTPDTLPCTLDPYGFTEPSPDNSIMDTSFSVTFPNGNDDDE